MVRRFAVQTTVFPDDFNLADYYLFDRLSEGLGDKRAILFGERRLHLCRGGRAHPRDSAVPRRRRTCAARRARAHRPARHPGLRVGLLRDAAPRRGGRHGQPRRALPPISRTWSSTRGPPSSITIPRVAAADRARALAAAQAQGRSCSRPRSRPAATCEADPDIGERRRPVASLAPVRSPTRARRRSARTAGRRGRPSATTSPSGSSPRARRAAARPRCTRTATSPSTPRSTPRARWATSRDDVTVSVPAPLLRLRDGHQPHVPLRRRRDRRPLRRAAHAGGARRRHRALPAHRGHQRADHDGQAARPRRRARRRRQAARSISPACASTSPPARPCRRRCSRASRIGSATTCTTASDPPRCSTSTARTGPATSSPGSLGRVVDGYTIKILSSDADGPRRAGAAGRRDRRDVGQGRLGRARLLPGSGQELGDVPRPLVPDGRSLPARCRWLPLLQRPRRRSAQGRRHLGAPRRGGRLLDAPPRGLARRGDRRARTRASSSPRRSSSCATSVRDARPRSRPLAEELKSVGQRAAVQAQVSSVGGLRRTTCPRTIAARSTRRRSRSEKPAGEPEGALVRRRWIPRVAEPRSADDRCASRDALDGRPVSCPPAALPCFRWDRSSRTARTCPSRPTPSSARPRRCGPASTLEGEKGVSAFLAPAGALWRDGLRHGVRGRDLGAGRRAHRVPARGGAWLSRGRVRARVPGEQPPGAGPRRSGPGRGCGVSAKTWCRWPVR